MSVHEQFAEDLVLYALGALEGGERASLEKHLDECASCRRELEQLRGDAALLALTTAGPRPPARAKSRLMDTCSGMDRHGGNDLSSRHTLETELAFEFHGQSVVWNARKAAGGL